VSGWRGAWGLWAVVTLMAIPASALLWLVGGMASCGEEDYDTPRGSMGDSLCQTFVKPVAPWLLLSTLPFAVVLVGGFIAIRRQNRRLFVAALTLPFALVVIGVFAALALF